MLHEGAQNSRVLWTIVPGSVGLCGTCKAAVNDPSFRSAEQDGLNSFDEETVSWKRSRCQVRFQ